MMLGKLGWNHFINLDIPQIGGRNNSSWVHAIFKPGAKIRTKIQEDGNSWMKKVLSSSLLVKRNSKRIKTEEDYEAKDCQ